MLYKTDIANLALGYLGSTQSVVDLDTENTGQAKIIRRHYRTAFHGFLESHPWNLATGYGQLQLIESSPSSGYAYAYGTPSDALVIRQLGLKGEYRRMYEYEDSTIDFKEYLIGGQIQIHTDLRDAYCQYTKQLNEDDGVPNYFGKGLAAHLAMEIAPSLITGKYAQIKQLLKKENDDRIGNSMAIDISRSPRPKDPPSPFERERNR